MYLEEMGRYFDHSFHSSRFESHIGFFITCKCGRLQFINIEPFNPLVPLYQNSNNANQLYNDFRRWSGNRSLVSSKRVHFVHSRLGYIRHFLKVTTSGTRKAFVTCLRKICLTVIMPPYFRPTTYRGIDCLMTRTT